MKAQTRHRVIWLLAIVLFVSVAATTIAFANIMGEYNIDDSGAISLISETDGGSDSDNESASSETATEQTEAGTETSADTETPTTETDLITDPDAKPSNPDAQPGFEASDDNNVWSTSTEVEIFRVSYVNGEQVITVQSSDGEKVIAPGTENSYTFKLKNTGNVPLRYKVDVDAYFAPEGITIPISARLSRYDGKWVTDGGTSFVPVPKLDSAEDSATLGAGRFTYYTLDWQWPFESGNDERDTLLGNMAVDEDLTFTIVIKTTAEFSGDYDDEGGILPPQTGDNSRIALWVTIAISSLVIIVVLLIIDRREKRSF